MTMASGTLKVMATPPLPFRSSSSKAASLTWTLPPVDDIRPLRLMRASFSGGTPAGSICSQASVSRSLGPARLNVPLTLGRPGSPDIVDFASSTRSPGSVALRRGIATTPSRASSSIATWRTGCLL